MDGLRLISEAAAAGLQIRTDGDRLVIRGPRGAAAVARKLLESKPDVLAALRCPFAIHATTPGTTGNGAADWRELFEERAAFRQCEAGYSADVAERLAYGEVIEAWCERHPIEHRPGICAGCHQPLESEVLGLSDGARVHWEHHREFACLSAYGITRRRRAAAALAAMGLMPIGE